MVPLFLHEHSNAFSWRQGEIFAEIGVVTAEGAFYDGYFLADEVGNGGGGYWRIELSFRLFSKFLPPFGAVDVGGHS